MIIRFNRFNHQFRFALFGTLLSCITQNIHADELQDAGKLAKQGQAAQALVKIDVYLANHPGNAEARLLKGTLLSEQDKTEEAIRIFTALTVEYPSLPEPHNNLAAIYAAQGQYEKAKAALEAALRTNVSYATAYANLSEIYAKMASIAYDKALQLEKGNNNNSNSSIRLAQLRDISPAGGKVATGKTQVASTDKTSVVVAKNDMPPVAAKSEAAAIAKPETAKPASTSPSQAAPAVQAQSREQTKPAGNEDILNAVNEWAKAWSARNANKYLSMYSAGFKTPGNISRSEWEKQRRERIAKPQPISVNIINARVSIKDENNARVSFVQAYRSGNLKSTTRKTLEMTRINGSWLIQEELTGV